MKAEFKIRTGGIGSLLEGEGTSRKESMGSEKGR